jgi:hypothetical protein
MTEGRSDSVIDLSIRGHDGAYTVTAPGIGIEVSAESRDDALRVFAAELSRVQTVMADHGFQLRTIPREWRGDADAAAGPETATPEKRSASRRLPVFWQCVIFTLLVLLGINQLILVPALDRAERLTLYVFGETSRDAGVRQIGRVVIDRIIDLAKATDEVTPERREQLRKALRTIAENSRPMIDALTSDVSEGENAKKGAAPSELPGDKR